MQPVLVDTYLAGLWKRHLPSELLWTTKAGHQGTITAQYVAPSWSWASLNHGVQDVSSFIYEDDKDSLVEILDVHVEPFSDSNVFGQVKSGTISLVGRIAKVCLEWSREDGEDVLLLGKEAKYIGSVYVHLDSAFSQLCGGNEGVWELYCVLLRQRLATDPLNRCALEGLLLDHTGVFAEFRRFGTFHAWEQEDAEAIFEACKWFAETVDSNVLGTAVEKQGSCGHMIKII